MTLPIETISHCLERAHFYYGVPHMFHEVIHYGVNLVGVYRAGQLGLKLRATSTLIKRLQKVSKKAWVLFQTSNRLWFFGKRVF